MNETPIKIAFTGHRHLSFAQIAQYLEKLFKDYPDAIWINGRRYWSGFLGGEVCD